MAKRYRKRARQAARRIVGFLGSAGLENAALPPKGDEP
jgi:hypothetical protein